MERKFSTTYTFGFAVVVCVVCSVLVSASAVALRDKQTQNKEMDIQKNVLIAAGRIKSDSTQPNQISELFKNVDVVKINRITGELLVGEPPKEIISNNKAGINKIPGLLTVYEFRENDSLETIVLPVSGKGLWSTMYGFLALEKDASTVKGLTFYQHGETPGLGGEIDNPKWKSLWPGKRVFKPESKIPALKVIKGGADPNDLYGVDALSGATLTSNGVTNLLDLWLSDQAYGPYLDRVRGEK